MDFITFAGGIINLLRLCFSDDAVTTGDIRLGVFLTLE